MFQELIETLWNVNVLRSKDMQVDITRINRNIVECKCILHSRFPLHRQGINRNIVECKSINKGQEGTLLGELIETLWNVNRT